MSILLSHNILRMETLERLQDEENEMKDKLLELIEDGDATSILDTEYTESLNELIKAEFISLVDDKLELTEKGQQAKRMGIKIFMENEVPVNRDVRITDFPEQKINSGISNQSFLIILLFFLISLVVTLTLTIL